MTTTPTLYARSLGPRQLARALADRGSLLARDQPVTFLVELDAHHIDTCDAWSYGQGLELGIFAFPGAQDLTVWRDPRQEQDRHHPQHSPRHVWLRNDQQPLPFERGVYVQNPEELRALLLTPDVEHAQQVLHTLRGHDERGVLEDARQRAEAAITHCETLRKQALALRELPSGTLHEALAAYGLEPWLLDVDPEHLSPILREPLEAIARSFGVTSDA